jgi:hypothetical protein
MQGNEPGGLYPMQRGAMHGVHWKTARAAAVIL